MAIGDCDSTDGDFRNGVSVRVSGILEIWAIPGPQFSRSLPGSVRWPLRLTIC